MITGLFVGFLLGFVLQRGRFCVVGAYRDLFLTKKATIFIALFIVIALQSVGVWILHDLGIIAFKNREFYWLSTIIGGIIFGFGMVIAGGCATGTWYRAGEGLIGSIVALFCYALGAAMTKYGALHFIQENLNVYTTRDSMIFQTLNVSPWVLVIVLCLATLFFALKELSKPKLKIARLKPKKEGISHILFEKAWHPFVTAILVAIIAIVAWVLSTWSGRADGLGITTPSANLMIFLTTGNTGIVDWGVFLVLGIFIGSFSAAKLSNEFRFRLPDMRTLALSACGGILMGFGASLAGGCTIGNGLVQTSLFSYQGWVAMIFFIIGAYIATYMFIIKKNVNAGFTTLAGGQYAK